MRGERADQSCNCLICIVIMLKHTSVGGHVLPLGVSKTSAAPAFWRRRVLAGQKQLMDTSKFCKASLCLDVDLGAHKIFWCRATGGFR